MNPNLQRHLFVRCPAHAERVLPDSALFTAERGERCVPVTACWFELLSDCADLGPVALVSQSAGAQFARCLPEVEFVGVPGGTEIVELGSGLVAETTEWSHVLAVEEPVAGGCLFSLQFFARDGAGLWKLLLTRDSQLEHFAAMIRHYASDTLPVFQEGVESSIPSRRAILESRGEALAHLVATEALAETLLVARREGTEVMVSVGRSGLVLGGVMVPRGLERRPGALYAYDFEAELHLATGEGCEVWRVLERGKWVLEVVDAVGELAVTLG